MFDMIINCILNALTWIVIALQIAGIAFGVVAFFLTVTWMQAKERKELET